MTTLSKARVDLSKITMVRVNISPREFQLDFCPNRPSKLAKRRVADLFGLLFS
jgi:hypothetical protein